jgi:hypothetical protein
MRTSRFLSVVMLIVGLGLGPMCATPCKAQTEIDPDHFEGKNVKPFHQPPSDPSLRSGKKDMHFRGKFSLPYPAECAGKKLPAGDYTLQFHSSGQETLVTLLQRGRVVRFPVRVAPPTKKAGQNCVILQRNRTGRRLAAFHLKDLDAVLYPGGEGNGKLESEGGLQTWSLPIT